MVYLSWFIKLLEIIKRWEKYNFFNNCSSHPNYNVLFSFVTSFDIWRLLDNNNNNNNNNNTTWSSRAELDKEEGKKANCKDDFFPLVIKDGMSCICCSYLSDRGEFVWTRFPPFQEAIYIVKIDSNLICLSPSWSVNWSILIVNSRLPLKRHQAKFTITWEQ